MSKIEELPPSDIEDESYSSKPGDVFLAVVDTPVKETDEILIEDSFIGGEPKWLHPDSQPPVELLKCGACKSADNMKLLLQAFSPLDDEQMSTIQQRVGVNNMNYVNPQDDRVLYVFLCTKCQRKGNSVRCIRGVKKNKNDDKLSEKMASASLGKNFLNNPFDITNNSDSTPNAFSGNPFENPSTATNPFGVDSTKSGISQKEGENKEEESAKASAKAARKLHDSQKDKEYDQTRCFKSYLLYVEEETFKNKKPAHLQLPKNLKIDQEALDLTGDEDLEKDPIKLDPRTEKLCKFLDDDVFQKFQEVVGYNPLQVLRYDLGGRPLLYAETKIDILSTLPRPGYNPSSQRIFEMQLMPKMIFDLEETVSVENGMEWGTILVFTDVENYIPKFDEHGVGYVEECVKVQWESRT
ncbi:small subunit rRNA maturation protein TSR4 [Saccharomyces eubayanus]|uniref:small subunit rRNA maturation protein TSR4 n=1 Tax=Saccharomyces eubayanus TaxID=1080349 RepID=UPI0006BF769B|nr:TSR4-like protein [Saccharomyces eubayanus]KOG99045.1 TSR4-like protein [Saccharomyces eubayanus]